MQEHMLHTHPSKGSPRALSPEDSAPNDLIRVWTASALPGEYLTADFATSTSLRGAAEVAAAPLAFYRKMSTNLVHESPHRLRPLSLTDSGTWEHQIGSIPLVRWAQESPCTPETTVDLRLGISTGQSKRQHQSINQSINDYNHCGGVPLLILPPCHRW